MKTMSFIFVVLLVGIFSFSSTEENLTIYSDTLFDDEILFESYIYVADQNNVVYLLEDDSISLFDAVYIHSKRGD